MKQFKLIGHSIALAVALGMGSAHAVRLNDIEVGSYLNEPLQARIKLTRAQASDLASLVPSLASREAFQAAGIERTNTLANLTFTLGPNREYLYIQSDEPVREPFLLFLMRADWDGGSTTREYAMLLDLPGTGTAADFEIPSALQADVVKPFLANPEIVKNTPQPKVEPEPAPVVAAPTPEVGEVTEIVVKSGDSLSRIARRYFDPAVAPSASDFAEALFELNPQAFIRGDINLLRAGVTLQIPELPQPAETSAPTQIAEAPSLVEEIAVVEAPNAQLTLLNDNGIVDDVESQFLRQRIQELELQLAQMQSQSASREDLGALIAAETGSALQPLSQEEQPSISGVPVVQPLTPDAVVETAVAPVAPVATPTATSPAKTGPAIAPVAVTEPTRSAPQPSLFTQWKYLIAGILVLILAGGAWLLRRKQSEDDVLELDDAFEPEPVPVAQTATKPVVMAAPRLATQDRSEEALLMTAYGHSAQAIELLTDSIEKQQDDDQHTLVRTLARITKASDPDAFAVLMHDQMAQHPERNALHQFLSELAGQPLESAASATATEQDYSYTDDIILGGEGELDTIEFTLELDEGKN